LKLFLSFFTAAQTLKRWDKYTNIATKREIDGTSIGSVQKYGISSKNICSQIKISKYLLVLKEEIEI